MLLGTGRSYILPRREVIGSWEYVQAAGYGQMVQDVVALGQRLE